MKFKSYIKNKGKTIIAQELGCSIHTVNSWYYGTRQPTVKQAKGLCISQKKSFLGKTFMGLSQKIIKF